MGISTQEFCIAMELFGATRLPDRFYCKHTTYVPCFQVGEAEFLHAGDGFVVQVNHMVPQTLITEAMAEFGETYPEGYNFRWDEIHSVEGILTLSAMIEKRYSKELVQKLVDSIYNKIIEQSLITSNDVPHFHSSKMDILLTTIKEYDNIVNPFGNPNFTMKNPSEYMKNIKLFLSSPDEETSILRLKNLTTQTEFNKTASGWRYNSIFWNTSNTTYDGGYTSIDHSFETSRNQKSISEYLLLQYTSQDDYKDYPGDIFLKLDLKTGMVCRPFQDKESHLSTDAELDTIIHYLKITIERLKQDILNHMIKSVD